jgi:CheY-like chemotaxis protein
MDGPVADEALRILIAEDNAANQLIIKGLLEPFGVNLSMVDNGEAAVAVFGQAAFDLVLMDIQMPRMDGIEAARRIRALEREAGSQPTPILALTANVMSGQIAAYRQAGMDGFVAKPIEAGALFAAIDGALHGGEVDGVGDAVQAA